MVNHVVMWNFKEGLSEAERHEAGKTIRQKLEAVKDVAEGVLHLEVRMNTFPSSNRDIALFCEFESEEALQAYQIHPVHLQAREYVKSVTCDRICFDSCAE